MTLIEIEARKATLVRQILTEVNTEDAVGKLSDFLQTIKEGSAQSISPELLHTLMAQAEREDDNGMFLSPEDMHKEIKSW